MPKKIPIRQCVACRKKKEKKQLCRIVRTPAGDIVFDVSGKTPGRGVYICKDENCLNRAIKSRALSKALEAPIPEEAVKELTAKIKEARDG